MGLKLEKAVEIADKFPNTPNKALSRILFNENPALYTDQEDARGFIRTARGAHGDKNRKVTKNVAKDQKSFSYNPYDLPKQDHHDNSPYQIKVPRGTKIGILNDIHMPYHDISAVTLALDECKKQKVTHLVLNGDIIDCYEISNFERDPSKRHFFDEIKMVKNFLSVLKKKFKNVKIIFKEGNHEKRFLRFMRRKAPELLGFEVFSLKSLLGLEDLGITHVTDDTIIKAGKLNIIHGHEFGHQIFSPVNPARGFFMKAKTHVIGGHHHQCSSHSSNDLDGRQIVAYSIGHLGDPHPEYRPINEWSHGFAIVKFDEEGFFNVNNYKIIKGKILST